MRLKRREKCPLHDSYFCCGREQYAIQKNRGLARGSVTRVEDQHHPRGYRELCSTAEKRRRLSKKLHLQNGMCGICGEAIQDFREADLDHIEPKCMGGARRDDHMDNLQAAHRKCNSEKGSKRMPSNEAGLYVVAKPQESA